MIRNTLKKIIRKLLVLYTWMKYHRRFELGENVVISKLKCVGHFTKQSVKIGDNSNLYNCSIVFNSMNLNRLIIGTNCNLHNAEFILRNGGGNLIELGSCCTTGGNVQFAACEGRSIRIGYDCQFAHNISCWTTDIIQYLICNGIGLMLQKM